MDVISVQEHQAIDCSGINLSQFSTKEDAKCSDHLGLFVEGRPLRLKSNYYIGYTWLVPGEKLLNVKPKINSLDWLSMFKECLNSDDNDILNKLPEIFGVEENQPLIQTDESQDSIKEILPALLAELLKPILAKGFKSNFVHRTENLIGKVKGSIDFNQHLRRNIITKREDRIYCRYQEYDIDCLENQIIKRSIKIVRRFGIINESHNRILKRAEAHLSSVGELKSISQMRSLNINSIYIDYKRLLRVAKSIILFKNNGIENNSDGKSVFLPYWINMPLLFELYVLKKLRDAYPDQIMYHTSTYGNELDFNKLNENLIIDAKYIPDWNDKIRHDNIRQLAGYARHRVIRNRVMSAPNDDEILPLLIVYPPDQSDGGLEIASDKSLINDNQTQAIDKYINAFTLCLKVPFVNNKSL